MIDLINPISFYNQPLSSYSQDTLFGVVTEGIPALSEFLKASVNKIALDVIAQVGISLTLFYLDHNVFILGLFVGFVFNEKVRETVEKVDIVYKAHRTFFDKFLLFGIGGLFFVGFHMPHTLIATTLYISSQWGALFFKNCNDYYRRTLEADKKTTEIDVKVE